jgi:glycosyltransferase involved in cell wall biosynthesis
MQTVLNPVVSIIIPYYNKNTTIYRCVESVLNQSYANWELILIDDMSNVPLAEIFQISDRRILLFSNEKNLGPGPTRQRGLNISRGEYVAYLDADDWWDYDFISKQLGNLSKETDALASWCKAYIYSDKCKNGELRRYNDINHKNLIYTLLKYGHSIQTSAFLWRKTHCGNWGNLSTNQDSFFEFSSSINNEKIVKMDEILLFRDETGEEHRSKYVNKDRMYLNTFQLYSSVYDTHNSNLSFFNRVLLFHRFLNAYYKVLINTTYRPYLEFKVRYQMLAVCLGENQLLIKLFLRLICYTPFKFYY